MYKAPDTVRQARFILPTNARWAAYGMHKEDIPFGTAIYDIKEDNQGLLWICLDAGQNYEWALVNIPTYPYRNYDELHKYFSSISYGPDNLNITYDSASDFKFFLEVLPVEEVKRNWRIISFEEQFQSWLHCYFHNKACKYDEELLELETNLLKRIENGWDSPDITSFTGMTIPNTSFTNAVLQYCAKGST